MERIESRFELRIVNKEFRIMKRMLPVLGCVVMAAGSWTLYSVMDGKMQRVR